VEEQVYERSLLPKGEGYPMYNPSPLERPAKLGDFGIITADGFVSFGNLYVGNLYDPEDLRELSIPAPPKEKVVCQSQKFKRGKALCIGMEDARRLADGGNDT
jgi:hypothetical protein